MRGFLRFSKARTLADLSLDAARQYIAHRQEAGLSDNFVHADYQTIKAFANWCAREELPVSSRLARLGAPKVAQKELATNLSRSMGAMGGFLAGMLRSGEMIQRAIERRRQMERDRDQGWER
jgi:site-specific recombinase XerD